MIEMNTTQELIRLREMVRAHDLTELRDCLVLTGCTVSVGFEDRAGNAGYVMASRSTGLVPEFDKILTEWFDMQGAPIVISEGIVREVRA